MRQREGGAGEVSGGASAGQGSKGSKGEGASRSNKWLLARTPDSKWEKDDLLDVIYWLRQVLGLLVGVLFGALGLTGLPTIAAFFAVNVFSLVFYYTRFLRVDVEDFGGAGELVKEGMMSSFGMFLVAWTCAFTLLGSESEYE